MRVAVGAIWQETATFSPLVTELADFERLGLAFGADMLARYGAVGELGGFARAAREDGVELVGTLRAAAWPSGPLSPAARDVLRDQLVAHLAAAGPVDAVLLAIHGALVARDDDDVEGALLAAVRDVVGPDRLVACSLDLHASITDRMVHHADIIRGYHTCPHIDLFETGYAVAKLLFRALRGEVRPVQAWTRLPMITPADRHDTTTGPFAALFDRLAALERDEPRVLAASLFAVQPWLDIAGLGWSPLVVTDGDEALARALVEELADRAWRARREFLVDKPPLAEALDQALAHRRRPVILSDAADATNAGAPGDSTAVLRALLDRGTSAPAYLSVVDAEAARLAAAAGPGQIITLDLGGKLDRRFGGPVRVTARVRSLSDGRYVVRGPMTRGLAVDMGLTAVLEIGAIRVVVPSATHPGHDPELYRSQGLQPEDAQLVVVKSPAGFRAAYAPFAAAILLADTPGCVTSDLASLPYRRAPRPLFPLDDPADRHVATAPPATAE